MMPPAEAIGKIFLPCEGTEFAERQGGAGVSPGPFGSVAGSLPRSNVSSRKRLSPPPSNWEGNKNTDT